MEGETLFSFLDSTFGFSRADRRDGRQGARFLEFPKEFLSARTVGAASREDERFLINTAFSKKRNAVERGEFANRRKKIKNANRRKTRFRRSRVLRSRRNSSRRGDEKVAAF